MNLFKCDRGASAVEYGLLVALIAAAIIGAVVTLGVELQSILHSPDEERLQRGFIGSITGTVRQIQRWG